MNCLITGASGFVGTNLVPYLKETGINTIQKSVRGGISKDIFNNIQSVVHLAGKAHDLKITSSVEEYYQINYELTKELYAAFLNSDVSTFIYISSVKAVADQIDTSLTESHIPNPKTDYGKSKLKSEEYIQKQELSKGKSYYILRPCMIHGAGNKGNLNLLHQFVSKGLPYPLASFDNKRSFLSIENLCFVIKEILERDDIPSGIYHLADDESLSTNEVVSLLAQAEHRSPRLLHIPEQLIRFIARIGDRLHLPLTTERLQKLTENYVVSNRKIKAVLNKELPLSAREGILKTGRSFVKG